jgi:uncharacterized iron-regulated membrane protein
MAEGHKWIGLGFLFLLEATTGCILVFQHEISASLNIPYCPDSEIILIC